jgi:hypothetical protein
MAAEAHHLTLITDFYAGLAILPIGRTLVKNSSADVLPAFGSRMPVFKRVDVDCDGTFVDFYHAIATSSNEVGNKLEPFQ